MDSASKEWCESKPAQGPIPGSRFQIIRYAWNIRNSSKFKSFKVSKDFIFLEAKEVRGEAVLYFGVFLYPGGVAPEALIRPIDIECQLLMTGELADFNFPDNKIFLGTVVMDGGSFVGHIWMRSPNETS